MTTVRDIMTNDVVSVSADDSTASAADMLTVLAISGVPVRNQEGKFVGVLSLSDQNNPRLPGSARHPQVADVMTPDVLSVYADDPALSAVAAMARHDIHRIFAVDGSHRLVGVVTALDIVKAVARGERFDVDAPPGLAIETPPSAPLPRMPDEAGRT
jgi:CBS-domain-containing membrane protein